MTSAALTWGSAFLAFGPILSLLFVVVYQKAQLVIVVTTSAFAYLLSALLAALIWWFFDLLGLDHPIILLLPGVISQFLMRCGFVVLYHKVEEVIERSIERHQQQLRQNETTSNGQPGDSTNEWTESARLRLELNDWACGVASGVGFGGMHVILLYGTLLASEVGNVGTLYQLSCLGIPGLMLSAINALAFSVMDMVWMFFTFFGMRLRKSGAAVSSISTSFGSYLGYSRSSGNKALGVSFVTHLAAAFSTMPNSFQGGCKISLPLLLSVVVFTLFVFRAGVYNIYLPPNQRRRVTGDGHRD